MMFREDIIPTIVFI